MEKTTKKKKSKKGLRKRIGIIAVGGLSLVLTVCLSVGATLAWFAGSTWASKSLYMGGPVYVEMAGRGTAGGTNADGLSPSDAKWIGGDGNLDIEAAAVRSTGTGNGTDSTTAVSNENILLPGQKVAIYSQARVYSTATTNTVDDNFIVNESSGENTTNTSNGLYTYQSSTGRVTTTTTSVLRARFSIEVEFDPGMGYNNFTDATYMLGYPTQSGKYLGEYGNLEDEKTAGDIKNATTTDTSINALEWSAALGAITYVETNKSTGNSADKQDVKAVGRRDAVPNTTGTWEASQDATACAAIRAGTKKSIYKWKYVSENEYNKAADALSDTEKAANGVKMAAPFDGTEKTEGGFGFYGVWVTEIASGESYNYVEADAFYKARCSSYLNSYVEYYVNEYGNIATRTVGSALDALEDSLNSYFVKLINDSSDAIHAGGESASWLYIDPSIGNDTNTDEISTDVGGWWYLVADNKASVGSKGDGDCLISVETDNVTSATATGAVNVKTDLDAVNTPTSGDGFKRTDKNEKSKDRLKAKLYEIRPDTALTGETVTYNKNGLGAKTAVLKTVSYAFPFVNGTFALPSDALTNIFANAKLTFKISFQALQAFFPYTESIDGVNYKSNLLGTAKALNIENAIPIFNEAFDYQEGNSSKVEGL